MDAYDLSRLILGWQSNHGKPEYEKTEFIDVFVQNEFNRILQTRILSNEYIFVVDTDSQFLLSQYGNSLNTASNKKAYDQMLKDYGHPKVLHSYRDPVLDFTGKFMKYWNRARDYLCGRLYGKSKQRIGLIIEQL